MPVCLVQLDSAITKRSRFQRAEAGLGLELTRLKAEVLSETPAELIMSSATDAFSAGSFGARKGRVGRTRTSYSSSAA
jgi:hypothetical protein